MRGAFCPFSATTTVTLLLLMLTCSTYPIGASLVRPHPMPPHACCPSVAPHRPIAPPQRLFPLLQLQEALLRTLVNVHAWVVAGLLWPVPDVSLGDIAPRMHEREVKGTVSPLALSLPPHLP